MIKLRLTEDQRNLLQPLFDSVDASEKKTTMVVLQIRNRNSNHGVGYFIPQGPAKEFSELMHEHHREIKEANP